MTPNDFLSASCGANTGISQLYKEMRNVSFNFLQKQTKEMTQGFTLLSFLDVGRQDTILPGGFFPHLRNAFTDLTGLSQYFLFKCFQ